MSAKGKKGDRGGIVIRKEEIIEGGHHGGAWKVAYADFVTAMMAFFLLMWLLNATSEEQRRGLADYFTPNDLMSAGRSGNGKPFGGHTPFDEGDMASDRGTKSISPGKQSSQAPPVDDPDSEQAPAEEPPADTEGTAARPAGRASATLRTDGSKAPGGGQAAAQAQNPAAGQYLANSAAGAAADAAAREIDDAAFRAEQERRERVAFERAAAQIREAVQSDPALAGLSRQLRIDMTQEGLRIQIIDEDRQPMFATGSAAVNDRARLLLQKIAPVLARLPEDIAISGHTDAAPFRGEGRTNWELSAERANATRRLLVEHGLTETRFRRVTGTADRDPLVPADPLAAANRRVAIVVLKTDLSAARRTP
ncbi:MAG: OmpA family protein [Alphaproteobacteria bacterium]|nr:OmpA family protein [Alphaproteobacteria bacterium]